MNQTECLRQIELQVDYIWGCAWHQERKEKEVRKVFYETTLRKKTLSNDKS